MYQGVKAEVENWAEMYAVNHYLYALTTHADEVIDPKEAIKRLYEASHYDPVDLPVVSETYADQKPEWVAEKIEDMRALLVATLVPNGHSPIKPLLGEQFLLSALRHDDDGNRRPIIYWTPGDVAELRPELSEKDHAVLLDGIYKSMTDQSVEKGWQVMKEALDDYEEDLKQVNA